MTDTKEFTWRSKRDKKKKGGADRVSRALEIKETYNMICKQTSARIEITRLRTGS